MADEQENKPLARSVLLTIAVLVGLLVVTVLLRIALNGQIKQIKEQRADEAAFLQSDEVAAAIRKQVGRKADVVERIEALLPPLTEVASVEDDLAASVGSFFSRRPLVEVGGVAQHPTSDSVQTVSFIITGRIRIENFDRVLEELARFPVLLEVDTVTLDIRAVSSPSEGEATYRGFVLSSF